VKTLKLSYYFLLALVLLLGCGGSDLLTDPADPFPGDPDDSDNEGDADNGGANGDVDAGDSSDELDGSGDSEDPTDSGASGDDPGAGAETCAPVAPLSCGSEVSGDNSDPNSGHTNAIDHYPVTVGNYSGPELAFTFLADRTEQVTWSQVDPQPIDINFDLFVLDGSSGTCLADQALTWGFSEVTFDAIEDHTYFLVLDGYNGDVGPYQVRLDCGEPPPPPEPDPAIYDECAFGWLSQHIPAAPHLRTVQTGQYTTVASLPPLVGQQMVHGITVDGWAPPPTVDQAFSYVDPDGVYELDIELVPTGEHFTWIKFYAGDTEVGYLYPVGSLDLVAIVSDGDVINCTVDLTP